MKIFLIITVVVAIIATIFFAFVKNNETYKYKILKEYSDFEIRKYESATFTSVEMDSGSYKSVSSKGFNILAGYIFGKNETKEKIAMTTPVTMELKKEMTMRFMVPSAHAKQKLPAPDNKQIKFEEIPERIVAVVRFSGWADDKKIEKHRILLSNALEREGLESEGAYTFMGYNAPFDPINRRNEVMVEVKKFEE